MVAWVAKLFRRTLIPLLYNYQIRNEAWTRGRKKKKLRMSKKCIKLFYHLYCVTMLIFSYRQGSYLIKPSESIKWSCVKLAYCLGTASSLRIGNLSF